MLAIAGLWLLSLSILAASPKQQLPAGMLDPSFGQDGVVTTAIGLSAVAWDVIRQPDEKIIVGGISNNGSRNTLTLARYEANGTLDSTFGQGGIATGSVESGSPGAIIYFTRMSMVWQSGDRILIASSIFSGGQETFGLVRYTLSGTLDSSFGTGGVIVTPIENKAGATSIVLQPDQKIVVTGYSNNGTRDAYAVARYQPDGTLDQSFGNGGVVVTAVSNNKDGGQDVIIQNDGKIVIVGSSISNDQSTITILRYLSNGNLDNGFGNGGVVTTKINRWGGGQSVIIQPDGKLLVGGWFAGIDPIAVLVRYQSNGQIDTGFGEAGISTQLAGNLGGCGSSISQLSFDELSRLLAIGAGSDCSIPSRSKLAVARFQAGSGNLDPSFGNGGVSTIGFDYVIPIKSYSGRVLTIQPDGKIIAVGNYTILSQTQTSAFALARFSGGNPVRRTYFPIIYKL